MDHETGPSSTLNHRLSVIIPVRDNPDGVRQVLECLAAQTLPADRFEVVIGDDGSHPDLSPRVVAGDSRVRVVSGPALTSYAARNRAVSAANGSVLAFCDSDCLPEPTWLEEGLKALTDADIVAGEVKFVRPPRPTVWSLLTIDLFFDQRQNVNLSRGVTANLLVRRRYFDELGGFDESLPSGGDYDFVRRAVAAGARLRYAPLAVVAHPTMDTARAFLRKIWYTNHWDGVRHARRKDKPDVRGVLAMLPVIGVVVARRRAFRPAHCLDRARLETCAIRPGPRDDLLSIAALYFVVCHVAGLGRVFGWLRGWWLARAGDRPTSTAAPKTAVPEARRTKGSLP